MLGASLVHATIIHVSCARRVGKTGAGTSHPMHIVRCHDVANHNHRFTRPSARCGAAGVIGVAAVSGERCQSTAQSCSAGVGARYTHGGGALGIAGGRGSL